MNKFDKSKTGSLDRKEFKAFMYYFANLECDHKDAEVITNEVAKEVFDKLDANHDEKISLDEFSDPMRD